MLQTIYNAFETVITLIFLLIFAWFASCEVEEDEIATEYGKQGFWEGVEPLPEVFMPDWFEFDPEFGQDIQDDWEKHQDEMYAQAEEEGYFLGNTFCPEVDDEFVEDYLGICF